MLKISTADKIENYNMEILRRSSQSPTNLPVICADIPIETYYSSEIVGSNDFYGNAEQIKRFLNLPSHYTLKTAIQHGNQYGGMYWDKEIKNILPISLAWGEHICSTWKKYTSKKIYKIGAPFFYTQSLFSDDIIKHEKTRLGKNLLVFPAHSMSDSTLSFDMEPWLKKIKEHSKDFQNVRICIYWKDYLLGRHRHYLEAGYECVSAGHLFDYNFLPRLRFLLEVCDATMSNRIGSFLGYSLFLKKPHIYIDQEINIIDYQDGCVHKEEAAWRNDPGVKKIFRHFSTHDFYITNDQFAVLDQYFGFSEIKSKIELLSIINEAEVLYKNNMVNSMRDGKNTMISSNKILQCTNMILRTAVKTYKFFKNELENKNIDVYTKFGNIKFFNINDMTLYRARTFFTKKPETLSWIESFRDNAIFWDIGANIGIYSLYAVRTCNAKVIAFEPSPFNIEILVRNIILNNMSENIDVCTLPLSNICQLGNFNMSCCYGGASGASFIKDYGEDGKKMNTFESVNLFGISGDIIRKIYELDCPDYIKLDVDGTEYLILQGIQCIIANKKLKSILVECCDLFEQQKKDINNILYKFGFVLDKICKSPLYTNGIDSHIHNYIYVRNK